MWVWTKHKATPLGAHRASSTHKTRKDVLSLGPVGPFLAQRRKASRKPRRVSSPGSDAALADRVPSSPSEDSSTRCSSCVGSLALGAPWEYAARDQSRSRGGSRCSNSRCCQSRCCGNCLSRCDDHSRCNSASAVWLLEADAELHASMRPNSVGASSTEAAWGLMSEEFLPNVSISSSPSKMWEDIESQSSKSVVRTAVASTLEVPSVVRHECLLCGLDPEVPCLNKENSKQILMVARAPCHSCVAFAGVTNDEEKQDEAYKSCAKVTPLLHPRTRRLLRDIQNAGAFPPRRALRRPCLLDDSDLSTEQSTAHGLSQSMVVIDQTPQVSEVDLPIMQVGSSSPVAASEAPVVTTQSSSQANTPRSDTGGLPKLPRRNGNSTKSNVHRASPQATDVRKTTSLNTKLVKVKNSPEPAVLPAVPESSATVAPVTSGAEAQEMADAVPVQPARLSRSFTPGTPISAAPAGWNVVGAPEEEMSSEESSSSAFTSEEFSSSRPESAPDMEDPSVQAIDT